MQALSPTDSAFLWLETRSQPMHVAGLNIYTPPKDAPPDYINRLMEQWGKHLSAKAPFNQRPVLKMGLWYWDVDTDFDLDYHLRHLALPHPGRIRELLSIVSRLHGNLMDRTRPLWEIYVIEGLPGGRFAIYSKIHHALVDGVGGAKLMAQSLSLTAQEDKPPIWAQSYPKYSRSKRESIAPSLLQQLANVVRAGREILPGVGSALWDSVRGGSEQGGFAMPFQAPSTPFNVEISGSRRFASQSYSLARLKRIGVAAGATVNDVTLAICAGALRQHLQAQNALPSKPLIAMVPVSLHGESEGAGNQVSVLLANLATDMADPLQRLQRIVQSTKEAKDRLLPMPRLKKLAHGLTSISPMGASIATGVAKNHPLFNVIISNVPGPKETLYLNGARLDEVYPVSIATHYLALNITISGYGDNLGFGYTACRRSVPALQRMLDYTQNSIQELEVALGLDHTAPRPTAAKKQPALKKTAVGKKRTAQP